MSNDPGQKFSNDGKNFTDAIRNDTYDFIRPTQFNLKGKTVLITGASRGVGRATAASFAKAGASGIVLTARSPLTDVEKEVQEAAKSAGHPGPKILSLKLDVTDRKNVEKVAKEVAFTFDGTLDILINNAGYLSSFAGIPETDPDEWWTDYEVNVKGVYLVTRAFWPLLLKSSMKIIVYTSSIGALICPPGATAYAPAKLAVLRLAEFINQDHGPGKDGIVAIAMHPGGVATDLAKGMPEFMMSYLVDTPELAGDTICWLGAERREWLGGRYISACWDLEEMCAKRSEIEKGDLLKMRIAINSFPS